MNDKLDQMSSQMQVKKTHQNIRSASGASHSSQYKGGNQGYGSTSGNETSKYRSGSNN